MTGYLGKMTNHTFPVNISCSPSDLRNYSSSNYILYICCWVFAILNVIIPFVCLLWKIEYVVKDKTEFENSYFPQFIKLLKIKLKSLISSSDGNYENSEDSLGAPRRTHTYLHRLTTNKENLFNFVVIFMLFWKEIIEHILDLPYLENSALGGSESSRLLESSKEFHIIYLVASVSGIFLFVLFLFNQMNEDSGYPEGDFRGLYIILILGIEMNMVNIAEHVYKERPLKSLELEFGESSKLSALVIINIAFNCLVSGMYLFMMSCIVFRKARDGGDRGWVVKIGISLMLLSSILPLACNIIRMYSTISSNQAAISLVRNEVTGCYSPKSIQDYLADGFVSSADTALVVLSLIGLGLASVFCIVYLVDATVSLL